MRRLALVPLLSCLVNRPLLAEASGSRGLSVKKAAEVMERQRHLTGPLSSAATTGILLLGLFHFSPGSELEDTSGTETAKVQLPQVSG